MTKILIIDDEDVFREEMAAMLREQNYQCQTAVNGKIGLDLAQEIKPDIVICDLIMPLVSGLEVLNKLRFLLVETQIIMITAYGSLETAIEAMRKGASDYILKPIDFKDLLLKIQKIIEHKELINEVRLLRCEINNSKLDDIIGESQKIKDIIDMIKLLKETKSNVLITGETGTGKELIARAIHSSNNSDKFIAVNCASMPESLIESELFGYTRGAFTGANQNKLGFIEAAHKGTLFLDEIGEMPLIAQAKLLRVIEERAIVKIGSTKSIKIDTRFIAATNRKLFEMIKLNQFRQDLYYRICVAEIFIPPLRERREDIPLLVDEFVRRFNRELKRNVIGVDNNTMQMLMLYDWPGNIRELRNVVERAMIFSKDGYLQTSHFSPQIFLNHSKETPDNLDEACKAYEKSHIQSVLEKVGGNRTKAAKRLGIDRSTLYRKLD